MKQRTLQKLFWWSFGFFMITHFLDLLSTYHFIHIKHYGIAGESNLLARWFFQNFGVIFGGILHTVLIIMLLFLSVSWLVKLFCRESSITEISKEITQTVLIGFFIACGCGSILAILNNTIFPLNDLDFYTLYNIIIWGGFIGVEIFILPQIIKAYKQGVYK